MCVCIGNNLIGTDKKIYIYLYIHLYLNQYPSKIDQKKK